MLAGQQQILSKKYVKQPERKGNRRKLSIFLNENIKDKIDAEAIAKYIIIRKNNIITMDKNTENTYTNLIIVVIYNFIPGTEIRP